MALELFQFLYQYSDLSPIPANAEMLKVKNHERRSLSMSVPEACKGAIVVITVFWRMHS